MSEPIDRAIDAAVRFAMRGGINKAINEIIALINKAKLDSDSLQIKNFADDLINQIEALNDDIQSNINP